MLRNIIKMHFLIVFTLSSCALNVKNSPIMKKIVLENSIESSHGYTKEKNHKDIRANIKRFRFILKQKKLLSKGDWKIHDDLLGEYIKLKEIISKKIMIPAKSKIIIPIETYCLDSRRASPNKKEIYRWEKKIPQITYYYELLRMRRSGKISQTTTQSLLWNLGNKVRWENYPKKYKLILKNIDPQAQVKLPSSIKDEAIKVLKNSIINIPGALELENAYNIAEGKFYEFNDYRESVESLISKQKLPSYNKLNQIPDTELYSQSDNSGFKSQKLSIYNPTDKKQKLDLSSYYLSPMRNDVQRIGINPFIISDQSLISDLEKVLFSDMARAGVGFAPVLNDIADLYEILTGKDFISGDNLDFTGRALSGVGLIMGSGGAYRYAKKVIHSPHKYIDEFSKGIRKSTNKDITLTDESIQATKKSLETSRSIIDSARKLKIKTKNGIAKLGKAITAKKVDPFKLNPTHKITMSKRKFIKFKEQLKQDGMVRETVKYVEHNGTKYIVDGHHRVRAAKELGMKNIPVEKVKLPFKGYESVDDLLIGGM